ncbi:hypothetical protein [Sphingobium yanoikuyae]|uniref:Uncharacterized protein n=1 Tax=Sphingobium yanoikuyae TaxID=13690 RepID=A0A0J9FUU8_SPHYA|nr:hypothetical protein [Sphingobium yanoikuyae]ATP19767.1 hypothetical protein BV87_16100 [Sphingobium yanoikuyae]KMW31960.1 hypothetical protein BV87_20925 [Sphingobium yanoikuyae]
MIGADMTRFFAARAAEAQHDIDGNGAAAQTASNEAFHLEQFIRAELNAILAPHGVTVAQIERMGM